MNTEGRWVEQGCGCRFEMKVASPDRFAGATVGKVERCDSHAEQWERICVMAKRSPQAVAKAKEGGKS